MGLFPFSFYLLSFSTHIPLLELIESELTKQLNQSKNCPISYGKMNLELFFIPTLSFKKVNIPGRCYNNRKSHFFIKTISVNALGPSIFPYSLKFAANATWNGGNIHSNLALSLNKTTIDIDKTRITLHTTLPSFTKNVPLSGLLDLQSKIVFSKNST